MKCLLVKILNFFERFSHRYKTEWVEDLPEKKEEKTIYIIGGRKYPFYAAVTCSRKQCLKTIHLEISSDFKRRWTVKEHENGTLTINPSIHVTNLPCKCHYWIRKGRIVWSEVPALFVPKENQNLQD